MDADVFENLSTPIGGVPATHIMAVWDRVEPILKSAVRTRTGFGLDHVLTELQLGNTQLWVIGNFDAVAITSVQVRPLHRVLYVRNLAGRGMESWFDDWVKVVEAFAKHNDCKFVEFEGRKAWIKLAQLRGDGYKPEAYIFRKELEDDERREQ